MKIGNVLLSQARDRNSHRPICKTDHPAENYQVSKHGHKVPNMLNIPEERTSKGHPFAPAPLFSFLQLQEKLQQLVFSFRSKDVITLCEGGRKKKKKILERVTILQPPVLFCGCTSGKDELNFTSGLRSAASRHKSPKYSQEW